MIGTRKLIGLVSLLVLLSMCAACAEQFLVVTNYDANYLNRAVYRFKAKTGAFVDKQGGFASWEPWGVVYGPDGDIYVSSSDGWVRRFDGTNLVSKGDPFTSSYSGAPHGLVFAPDGSLLVTTFWDGNVNRFNGSTGQYIDTPIFWDTGGSLSRMRAASFGPDGNLYITTDSTAGYINSVKKYSGADYTYLGEGIMADSGGLNSAVDMTFGPDGNIYVSNYNNGSVKRYDASTGAYMGDFVVAGSGGLVNAYGLRFGPDGNLYVADYSNGAVKRYNGSTGAFIDNFVPAGTGGITHATKIAFTPASTLPPLAVTNNDPDYQGRAIFRFDSSTGAFKDKSDGFGSGEPFDVTYGPGGDVYASFADGWVRRFDGTTLVTETDPFTSSYSGLPYGIAFTPDNKLLLTTYWDGNVNRYDGLTGAFINTPIYWGQSAELSRMRDIGYSLDGNIYIVTDSGGSYINQVQKYSATTFQYVSTYVSANSGGLDIAADATIGPDGHMYISSYNTGSVKRYHEVDGTFMGDFVASGAGGLVNPYGLRFGPDGNLYVADYSNGAVKCYNGQDGTFIEDFVAAGTHGMNQATKLAFPPVTKPAPDIEQMVVGNFGWTASKIGMYRYNASTGVIIDRNAGFESRPGGVVIGSDGDVYVASHDGFVRRYSKNGLVYKGAFTSRAIRWLVEPAGMAFGPDGNLYVVSGGQNAVARFNGTTGAYIDEFVPRNDAVGNNLRGLAFGPDGNLYISTDEGVNSRVIKYNGANGAFISNFVSAGSGGLYFGYDLTFGPDGSLYVSSYNNSRVKKYSGTNGAFIGDFCGAGTLNNPSGLRFGPNGDLYVADLAASRVWRYDGVTGDSVGEVTAGYGLQLPTYLAFYTPLPPDVTIATAKTVADGTRVKITSAIVSATFNEAGGPVCFAIEDTNRTVGIRITSDEPVSVRDAVTIEGKTATVNGERVIQADPSIDPRFHVDVVTHDNQEIAPLGMTNRATAGGSYGHQEAVADDAETVKMSVGANTVGLLTKIWGKVSGWGSDPSGALVFYVDDGSGLSDGSGIKGIMCRMAPDANGDPGLIPSEQDYVSVTGVMGVTDRGGVKVRYLWTTSYQIHQEHETF